MSATDLAILSCDGPVATITLNRADQFNALSLAMLHAVSAHLANIRDNPTVRVLVITGSGRAFCAGHDLAEMRGRPDRAFYAELFRACSTMMATLQSLPQPVIARVNGVAAAAGCQLVAACDLAIAADTATFAVSGIRYGLFCATPAVPVTRAMPRKPALEMLFTGDAIGADSAVTYGLINRAVPMADLDQHVSELAAKIASKPAISIARGKRLFYAQVEQPQASAYLLAESVMADNMLDPEAQEGFQAFLDKRKPVWR